MEANLIELFKNIVGNDYVKQDPETTKIYGSDWTKQNKVAASLVIFPKTTEEVSKILQLCNQEKLAIIPSGGRTGLAGGAVATKNEIILSLDRMNRIEKIDEIGMLAKVEAGVSCEAVQNAAKEHNMFFALDLASKGSCQIGGNLATNAGGLKLIRYGGAREQVLGIEVVLADGSILDLNQSLRKNNTGVDLKQLFISSEGTLGVITRATLKLQNIPRELLLICAAIQKFEDIPKLMKLCNQHRLIPTAFEFFSDQALHLVEKFHSQLKSPFQEKQAYYVLLEFENPSLKRTDGEEILEKFVSDALEQNLMEDAVIASNSEQFKSLWGLRENISESVAQNGLVRKNDIALAIEDLDAFVAELNQLLKEIDNKEISLIIFGHIGDGNLHINYIADRSMNNEMFHKQAREIEKKVFAILRKYRGSISAEHGIGLLKKEDFLTSKSVLEVSVMKNLKKMFDPNNILNPGKIFDL